MGAALGGCAPGPAARATRAPPAAPPPPPPPAASSAPAPPWPPPAAPPAAGTGPLPSRHRPPRPVRRAPRFPPRTTRTPRETTAAAGPRSRRRRRCRGPARFRSAPAGLSRLCVRFRAREAMIGRVNNTTGRLPALSPCASARTRSRCAECGLVPPETTLRRLLFVCVGELGPEGKQRVSLAKTSCARARKWWLRAIFAMLAQA